MNVVDPNAHMRAQESDVHDVERPAATGTTEQMESANRAAT